jgi:hypothetical protein
VSRAEREKIILVTMGHSVTSSSLKEAIADVAGLQAKFLREAQWAKEADCRCRHERLGSVWDTRETGRHDTATDT